MNNSDTHIAFQGISLVCRGDLREVALEIKNRKDNDADDIEGAVFIFETQSGQQIDIDTRGSVADVRKRYTLAVEQSEEPSAPTLVKRGRPKLGVVGREVTLLPRHWEWLDRQRGGASASLRRLIDEARKVHADEDLTRLNQNRTYSFIRLMAGDLAGFEEASRMLFSGNQRGFNREINHWPEDIKAATLEFSQGAFQPLTKVVSE